MSAYVRKISENIRKAIAEQNLPIEFHLVEPDMKNRYWYKVLGKGTPPVIGKSMRHRWCTDSIKIKPTDTRIRELLAKQEHFFEEYDMLMVLGVRDAESAARKASIAKFTIHDKFARHAEFNRVLVYHPIKYISKGDLWSYLLNSQLPWGDSLDLYTLYSNADTECPMTKADGKQGASCGGSGSRFGCWVCTVANEDKMLKNQILNGDESLKPLYEYKMLLKQIRNDVRYRQPIHRNEYKKVSRRLQALDTDQMSVLDLVEDAEYENFQRATNWAYDPGSLTFEARKLLLQKLLYVQQESRYPLINQEEIQTIVDVWRSEGYSVSLSDLQPLNWAYDGALVLRPDGSFNTKETTYTGPIFAVWVEFLYGEDEVIEFLKQREIQTGKSISYFMTYCDYHEHFGMDTTDLVYNNVQFIVTGVETYKQACDYVENWLGYNEPVAAEQMNWNAFAERTYAKALEIVQQPYYDLDSLERMNKTLRILGYVEVSATTPLFQVDANGQLMIC